ncbi:TniQ family protein [Micropruina glycogenica]|uniref:TniQ domain-containing protein n=1 Tax=Micropruina glycogenica TaxID=75385 RepID=A0A2N9JJN6_9ACTN|nr:TniQ family protein [Micropruina glycogenica]SPD87761.1 conserved protein of unknown function [Micropruina glycogenica]
MIDHLPARVEPVPDETLDSWLERLATANTLPVRLLLPPELSTTQLAQLLRRKPADLHQMTRAGYHRSVVGRPHQRTLTWRTDQHQWICPRCCTAPTDPRLLPWQLALHPLCRACGCFLVQSTHDVSAVVEAHPAMIDLVTMLMGLTQTAWTNKNHAQRLRRLRRLTNLIARTLDEQWPPRQLPLPAIDPQSARLWGQHTAPDPLIAATLLAICAPLGPTRLDRLTEQGWSRLGDNLDVPIGWLPKRPSTLHAPRRPTYPTPPDRARLKNLRFELHRLQRSYGLEARHVPSTLYVGAEYPLPHRMEWNVREFAAVALVMQLADLDAVRASQYLDLPYHPSPAFADIELGRRIRPQHATLLRMAARKLLRDGLVDYQYRRRTLTAHHRLEPGVLRRLRLPEPAEPLPDPETLALDWLWITLTRSTLTSSRWPLHSTSTALHYGEYALDGEQRLILLEHGHSLLRLTQDDIAHDQQPAPATPDLKQAQ